MIPLPLRPFCFAALVAALAGCSVGEDYQRPAVAVPPSWTAEAAAGEAVSAQWWKGFEDPVLDALIARASIANLDLAQAVARVREADATLRINGAALLPALDLTAGGSRAQTPVSSRSGSSASRKASIANSASVGLETSYEIDFWGKNSAAWANYEALASASRFDRQTVLLTVQSSVATTYFTILGYRDRLAVARQNLANSREVLDAIADRVRAGTATDLDYAQQESVVATNEAEIPSLEQSLAQNVNALSILLGQAPGPLGLGASTLVGLRSPRIAPGLPSDLLARRPDIRYAEYQLIAANADIASARAQLFPAISLTGQLGTQSAALSDLFSPASMLWSLAGSLSQPIFHGGALRGGVDLKEGRYEELVAAYRAAVIAAFSDVEDALVATRRSSEQEGANQKVVATSRRAYDIARAQLEAGTTDIVTLLSTQRSLFTAEDSLVQARQARLQAAVGLFKALGGGWDGSVEAPLSEKP